MLNAYKTKNALVLIRMCQKFNIDYILTDDILFYIENNVNSLEKHIDELQHHLCWLWCTADEETKKNFKLP